MKIDSKVGNLTLEQGLLVFALVLLTGAGLYKAFTYAPEPEVVAGWAGAAPVLKDPKLFAPVATGFGDTPLVKPREHNLFIPRLIIFSTADGSISVLNWDAPMQDLITPRWKQENGFELDDPTVATADPDQDGYSNKEEYDAKTDPNNKTSAPPVINKLYVKTYNPVQLEIIFKGYNETEPGSGIYEYQINTPTLPKRSWRLKEGEIIRVDEFNKYVIGKFRMIKKMVVNPKTGVEEEKDFSELDVTDPRLNETITLLFDKRQNSDQSTVGFELAVPGEFPQPAEVAIGQKFKVRGAEYQLRSVTNGEAVILDLASKKELTIPKQGANPAPAVAPVPGAGQTPPSP